MTTAPKPAGQATFTVNGTSVSVPGDDLLLSALRDRMRLTGAKLGCGDVWREAARRSDRP